MATQPSYPLLRAEDFLDIDFGERKAELDNGVIRMMAGGTRRHAQVSGNISTGLNLKSARYTACGSRLALRTHDRSVRFADVAIYPLQPDAANDDQTFVDDPVVIVEVLSAGTARTDLRIKLEEYRELPSVDTIVFVDIATERLRIIQRTGPAGWNDVMHTEAVDVALPSLGLTLPHAEIFARD